MTIELTDKEKDACAVTALVLTCFLLAGVACILHGLGVKDWFTAGGTLITFPVVAEVLYQIDARREVAKRKANLRGVGQPG